MDARLLPMTIAVSASAPYVHLDNRALVLHDGRSCVMFSGSAFPWIAETLRVLHDERRATRQQGPSVFGGFLHDDGAATLYAGSVHHLITCDVAADDLEALRTRLTTR